MAFELRTEIEIDATPARVWAVLSDFQRYPEWNPFVTAISGALVPGSDLRVALSGPGGRSLVIRPRLSSVVSGSEFAWRGKLLSGRVFVGEHRFQIVPVSDRRVRFVHSEQFAGVLVPALRKLLNTQTRAGFEAMNRALKARAEAA
jgi:hypothetical protein